MQEGIGVFRSLQMDDILSSNCVTADCTEQENTFCITYSGRYLVSPVNMYHHAQSYLEPALLSFRFHLL